MDIFVQNTQRNQHQRSQFGNFLLKNYWCFPPFSKHLTEFVKHNPCKEWGALLCTLIDNSGTFNLTSFASFGSPLWCRPFVIDTLKQAPGITHFELCLNSAG